MTLPLLLLLLSVPSAPDSTIVDVLFRREHLARLEANGLDELSRLEDAPDVQRAAPAIALLDSWLGFDPRPGDARRLLESFDLSDATLCEAAPRLLAHFHRAYGRLDEAHEWERRASSRAPHDASALLLVASELRTVPTEEAEARCEAVFDQLVALLPYHTVPLYLRVDVDRTSTRCDDAIERLERFATFARDLHRPEVACWAHGLAAEIESRDQFDASSAVRRCREFRAGLAPDASPALVERADLLVEWYSRSEREARRTHERRTVLRFLAILAASAAIATLAFFTLRGASGRSWCA